MIDIIVLSIVAHELGHLMYFYSIGIKTSIHFNSNNWKLQVGYPSDYIYLKDYQLVLLYLSGIITGLLVILFYIQFDYTYLILLPIYFAGCKKDIKNILVICRNTYENYS